VLIRRGKHESAFVILPNATVRDERLSHLARGILAEILSYPDGWTTTADRLAEQSRSNRGVKRGAGRPAYREAFAELEAAGYLHRIRHQDDRGRWATVMVVFDTPKTDVQLTERRVNRRSA